MARFGAVYESAARWSLVRPCPGADSPANPADNLRATIRDNAARILTNPDWPAPPLSSPAPKR